MIDPVREARIAWVATQRLGFVRCAVEHVYHRHNTSAILRTCDALGVHRVHLVGSTPLEVCKGAARGADHWLELHAHDTTAEAIAAIKASGTAVWVADLASPPTAPVDLPLDRPICIWLGAEVVGVSDAARAAADGVVTIPMHGFAQSLNVSVAAALILHVVTERARAELGARALLPPSERTALLEQWLGRELEDLQGQALRDRAAGALAKALDGIAVPAHEEIARPE